MRTLACLALFVSLVGAAGAQFPITVHRDVTMTDGVTPTFWVRYRLGSATYNYANFSGLLAVSRRRLPNPIPILRYGTLEIDLGQMFFVAPMMNAKLVDPRPGSTSGAEVMLWTKLPTIPASLVGTKLHYQVLLFNKSGPSNYRIAPRDGMTIHPK